MMLRRSFRIGSSPSRATPVTRLQDDGAALRRDMHDALGPTLVGAALLAKSLASAVPDELRGPATRLQAIVEAAMAEARALARGHRPASVDLGRELAALAELCAGAMGVQCRIEGGGVDAVARDGSGGDVLYFVREAVTNAVRHGHARHVTIRVLADEATRTVSVEDDGDGLLGAAVEGVGWASMRERAARLGGVLAIEAMGPTGVAVRCAFPAAASGEVRS